MGFLVPRLSDAVFAAAAQSTLIKSSGKLQLPLPGGDTFNTGHFRQIAPPAFVSRIVSP